MPRWQSRISAQIFSNRTWAALSNSSAHRGVNPQASTAKTIALNVSRRSAENGAFMKTDVR